MMFIWFADSRRVMKHWILIVLLLLGSCAQNNESIKVGAILPLSGTAASAGASIAQGMQIAVDETNRQGGIDGRPLELLIEDSKGNPQEAISAFLSINTQHDPIAMVSALSAVSMALAPVAQEQNIPLIATATTAMNLTNDWTFRYYPRTEDEARVMQDILQRLDVKTLAILHLNDEFGVSIAKELSSQFKGKIVIEAFEGKTQEFETQVLKLQDAKPDALLIVGFASHIIKAAKTADTLGFKGAILAPSTASSPEVRDAVKNLELYAPASRIYDSGLEANTERFISEYEHATNHSVDHYAAAGYDVMRMVAKTSEEATSPDEFRDELNTMDFEGILGSSRHEGHEYAFPLYPSLVSNGRVDFLSEND